MIDLKGKYCTDCKVYADTVEDEALSQIYDIINNPAFKGQKIRIMPDVHAGKGITIGFSSTIGDFVNPSHIGCDIGCTVSAMFLNKKLNKDDYALFEQRIRNSIPFGFDIQPKRVFETKDLLKFIRSEFSRACASWGDMINMPSVSEKWLTDTLKRLGMDEGKFYRSISSVGGGNHFLEYDETEDGKACILIHCGSRNFGQKVFKFWDSEAKRTPRNSSVFNLDERIKEIKATEKDRKKWKVLIEEAKEYAKTCNPQGYLSGERLSKYLSDMVLATAYSKFNHIMIQSIIADILLKFTIKVDDTLFTMHNYIDFEDHIIRKGSVKSYEGKKFLLPFNMKDGVALCIGKSNEDWNYTSPHGAGRIMSRSAAKKNIDVDEYKKSMEGIYSTCVGKGTIDEAPMAYKNTDEIIKLIEPTCEIIDWYKPKINLKASDTSIGD